MLEQKRKRAPAWKEGRIVVFKLMDDLYTIVQMHKSPYYLFFDIYSKEDNWDKVDLSQTEHMFIASTMGDISRDYSHRVIPKKNAIPRTGVEWPSHWIWPKNNPEWVEKRDDMEWIKNGGYSNKGGELRKRGSMGGSGGKNTAKLVMRDIPYDDVKTLTTYDFAGLCNFNLIERLVLRHYLKRDADPEKVLIFPESEFLRFPNCERVYNGFMYRNQEYKAPDFEKRHFDYLLDGIA